MLCVCPEKRKLSDGDQPLWERILQGPSDDIMKIFLINMDEQEVSNAVSCLAVETRHIHFNPPVVSYSLFEMS